MNTTDQIADEICGIVADDGRFRSDIIRILKENFGDRVVRADEIRELQDWRELVEAVCSLPLPEEHRRRKLWPNDWHQDCAAVAFLIQSQIDEKAAKPTA